MNADHPQELKRLVEAVRSGPKYARLVPEFVASQAARELAKPGQRRSQKELVKAVRNKLHQVAGAYLEEEMRYPAWLAEIKAAAGQGDPALKEACRKVMRFHASTRERLPILDQFYADIFAALPPIHSVLDAACGLNPLALPWMPLAEGARYRAVDIYLDMMDFLNGFFEAVQAHGQAEAADVIESPPQEAVELALLLKAVPCLEQAERSAAERLLGALQADYLLVSFPVHSLGGRSKGMAASYENRFSELAQSLGWSSYQRFSFATELAFLVQR